MEHQICLRNLAGLFSNYQLMLSMYIVAGPLNIHGPTISKCIEIDYRMVTWIGRSIMIKELSPS